MVSIYDAFKKKISKTCIHYIGVHSSAEFGHGLQQRLYQIFSASYETLNFLETDNMVLHVESLA